MEIWMWIVIVVAVLAIVALIAWAAWRRRRHEDLRSSFGPEYDRAVRGSESVRAAESDLEDRRRRRASYDIHQLTAAGRARYAERWRAVQERFVDSPGDAVRDADTLIVEVMRERGYPTETDFEQRVGDLSVDHARVVDDYRSAHALALANERGEAGTEELREAMVSYRSLFDALLEPNDDVAEREAR